MAIAFDDALRAARKSIGDLTGDTAPEVLRFELRDGFNFRFRTAKGDYDITIEPGGAVGMFARGGAPPAAAPQRPVPPKTDDRGPPGEMTRQAAMERALAFAGGGMAEKARPSKGGWDVDIGRGLLKPELRVHVGPDGTVTERKRSKLDFLGLELE